MYGLFCVQFKGGIDNKNESEKYAHSLNKDRRKRELQKITKENRQILKRIEDAQPTYDHSRWEEEADENDRILQNICEFKPQPYGSEQSRTGRTRGYLDDGADDEHDHLYNIQDDFYR